MTHSAITLIPSVLLLLLVVSVAGDAPPLCDSVTSQAACHAASCAWCGDRASGPFCRSECPACTTYVAHHTCAAAPGCVWCAAIGAEQSAPDAPFCHAGNDTATACPACSSLTSRSACYAYVRVGQCAWCNGRAWVLHGPYCYNATAGESPPAACPACAEYASSAQCAFARSPSAESAFGGCAWCRPYGEVHKRCQDALCNASTVCEAASSLHACDSRTFMGRGTDCRWCFGSNPACYDMYGPVPAQCTCDTVHRESTCTGAWTQHSADQCNWCGVNSSVASEACRAFCDPCAAFEDADSCNDLFQNKRLCQWCRPNSTTGPFCAATPSGMYGQPVTPRPAQCTPCGDFNHSESDCEAAGCVFDLSPDADGGHRCFAAKPACEAYATKAACDWLTAHTTSSCVWCDHGAVDGPYCYTSYAPLQPAPAQCPTCSAYQANESACEGSSSPQGDCSYCAEPFERCTTEACDAFCTNITNMTECDSYASCRVCPTLGRTSFCAGKCPTCAEQGSAAACKATAYDPGDGVTLLPCLWCNGAAADGLYCYSPSAVIGDCPACTTYTHASQCNTSLVSYYGPCSWCSALHDAGPFCDTRCTCAVHVDRADCEAGPLSCSWCNGATERGPYCGSLGIAAGSCPDCSVYDTAATCAASVAGSGVQCVWCTAPGRPAVCADETAPCGQCFSYLVPAATPQPYALALLSVLKDFVVLLVAAVLSGTRGVLRARSAVRRAMHALRRVARRSDMLLAVQPAGVLPVVYLREGVVVYADGRSDAPLLHLISAAQRSHTAVPALRLAEPVRHWLLSSEQIPVLLGAADADGEADQAGAPHTAATVHTRGIATACGHSSCEGDGDGSDDDGASRRAYNALPDAVGTASAATAPTSVGAAMRLVPREAALIVASRDVWQRAASAARDVPSDAILWAYAALSVAFFVVATSGAWVALQRADRRAPPAALWGDVFMAVGFRGVNSGFMQTTTLTFLQLAALERWRRRPRTLVPVLMQLVIVTPFVIVALFGACVWGWLAAAALVVLGGLEFALRRALRFVAARANVGGSQAPVDYGAVSDQPDAAPPPTVGCGTGETSALYDAADSDSLQRPGGDPTVSSRRSLAAAARRTSLSRPQPGDAELEAEPAARVSEDTARLLTDTHGARPGGVRGVLTWLGEVAGDGGAADALGGLRVGPRVVAVFLLFATLRGVPVLVVSSLLQASYNYVALHFHSGFESYWGVVGLDYGARTFECLGRALEATTVGHRVAGLWQQWSAVVPLM